MKLSSCGISQKCVWGGDAALASFPPQLAAVRRREGVRTFFSDNSSVPATTPLEQKCLKNLAINFHFTRKCNFSCKFCFHTSKTSKVLTIAERLQVLKLARDAGAAKVNFAGGEPFLQMYQKDLGRMVRHAKEDLGYESVSIISNGSQLRREWFDEYGRWLDILGISTDSDQTATNTAIGRRAGSGDKNGGDQAQHARRAAAFCADHGIKFKLNTVVCAANAHEDLSGLVNELKPMRWKVFQVLPLQGENSGAGSLRDVSSLLISDAEFQSYVARNAARLADPSIMKVEDNATMQNSYVLIDEHGQFLDCSAGGKRPTQSILKVGVQTAMQQLMKGTPDSECDGGSPASTGTACGATSRTKEPTLTKGLGFDRDAFLRRDGYYPSQWSRATQSPALMQ